MSLADSNFQIIKEPFGGALNLIVFFIFLIGYICIYEQL